MNTNNETVVSPEMYKKLREAALADDYKPVPRELESRARKLLGKKQIVSYSNDSKFKKKLDRTQNRLREAQRKLAAQSPIVLAQLAAQGRSRG